LNDLPYTISLPQLSTVIVHAGLVPGRPLGEQTANDMSKMRNVVTGVRWWGGRGHMPKSGSAGDADGHLSAELHVVT
jgi:hypothetical protein